MFEEINPYIMFVSRKIDAPNIPCYRKRKVRWYELELITTGGGYIETDGKQIKTEEGAIFFRKPGMVVQGFLPYTGYLIVFDMCYNAKKADFYSNDDSKGYQNIDASISNQTNQELDLPNVIYNLNIDKYEDLFNSIYEKYAVDEKANHLSMKAKLLVIINELLKDYKHLMTTQNEPKNKSKYYSLMNGVKKYIIAHIAERLSLDDLADFANLSPSFLSRTFKSTMGIGIFEYINNKKVESIKKLLIDTNMSITKICELYGYTESFFFRLFKKKIGKTPKEFRDEYLEIKERYL